MYLIVQHSVKKGAYLVKRVNVTRRWKSNSVSYYLRYLGFIFYIGFFIGTSAVFAQTKPDQNQEYSKNLLTTEVALSVFDAPVDIFYKALFANTQFVVSVDQGIDQRISGSYSGTVAHVLKTVNSDLSLRSEIDNEQVLILPVVKAPSTVTTQPRLAAKTEEILESLPESTRISNKVVETNPITETLEDPIVERLFLLSHSRANDLKVRGNTNDVIPGVATRLLAMMEEMDFKPFDRTNTVIAATNNPQPHVVALAAMNGLVVRDYESKMVMYRDLIKMLDSPTSGNQLDMFQPLNHELWSRTQPNTKQASQASSMNWQEVR